MSTLINGKYAATRSDLWAIGEDIRRIREASEWLSDLRVGLIRLGMDPDKEGRFFEVVSEVNYRMDRLLTVRRKDGRFKL